MSAIKLTEHILNDLENLHSVFERIKNGVTLTNEKSTILYVNPAFSQITGYSRDEALGQNPGLLRSGYHDEAFYQQMWQSLQEHGFWEGEIWNRQKSGRIYPSLLTVNKFINSEGKVSNYLGIFSDITFLESDTAKQINLAYYDPLTKLYNRLALKEHFERLSKTYQREHYGDRGSNNDKIVLLFFDLNKFKSVNDNYGHVVGDKLLTGIAERLKTTVRDSDVIARFGGDEFVGIMPGIVSVSDIKNFCTMISQLFAKPFNINEHVINSSASIGVAVYPDDGTEFEKLITKADEAMYHAKKHGLSFYLGKDLEDS